MRSQLLKESQSIVSVLVPSGADGEVRLPQLTGREVDLCCGDRHTPAVASSVSSMVPGVWTGSLLRLDTA